jgi:hypothetical protein
MRMRSRKRLAESCFAGAPATALGRERIEPSLARATGTSSARRRRNAARRRAGVMSRPRPADVITEKVRAAERSTMRPPRRPAASFVPRLESLEDRRLLAAPVCTINVTSAGVVFIRGSNRNDRIQIIDNGTTAVNNVVLVCDNQTVLPGVAVNRVSINTRNGNDSVTYLLTSGLVAGASRTIQVDLGAGDDGFSARFNAGLLNGSNLSLVVNGGDGNNRMNLFAGNLVSIGANAFLNAAFTGGPSTDVIQANYLGQVSGGLSLLLSGGRGDDLISAQVTLTQGSIGNSSVQEFGGLGDDTLVLNQQKQALFDRATITGTIDGGPGNNKAVFSSGVSVTHGQRKVEL